MFTERRDPTCYPFRAAADPATQAGSPLRQTTSSGSVVAAGRRPAADRFQLDYATWRARLAAPGSTFEPNQSAPSRAAGSNTMSLPLDAAEPERRAA